MQQTTERRPSMKTSLPPDVPVMDCRTEPRLRCNARLRASACEGSDAGEFHVVTATDCSARGICLILPRPVRVGGQVLVQFDGDGATIALYTVRNCKQLESGVYRVGAMLVGFNRDEGLREHPLALLKSLLAQGR
jgi:hypothetical protein